MDFFSEVLSLFGHRKKVAKDPSTEIQSFPFLKIGLTKDVMELWGFSKDTKS